MRRRWRTSHSDTAWRGGVQIVLFQAFGLVVSLEENVGIGPVNTTVSIVRNYILRRLFEALR